MAVNTGVDKSVLRSKFTVVYMEKGMQDMVITTALLTQCFRYPRL